MFWLLKPYISEIVLKQRDQLPKIKFFILDIFYKVDDRIEKKDVLEKNLNNHFFLNKILIMWWNSPINPFFFINIVFFTRNDSEGFAIYFERLYI